MSSRVMAASNVAVPRSLQPKCRRASRISLPPDDRGLVADHLDARSTVSTVASSTQVTVDELDTVRQLRRTGG